MNREARAKNSWSDRIFLIDGSNGAGRKVRKQNGVKLGNNSVAKRVFVTVTLMKWLGRNEKNCEIVDE